MCSSLRWLAVSVVSSIALSLAAARPSAAQASSGAAPVALDATHIAVLRGDRLVVYELNPKRGYDVRVVNSALLDANGLVIGQFHPEGRPAADPSSLPPAPAPAPPPNAPTSPAPVERPYLCPPRPDRAARPDASGPGIASACRNARPAYLRRGVSRDAVRYNSSGGPRPLHVSAWLLAAKLVPDHVSAATHRALPRE
jgi:hypothetical protein